jgi:hypothetical protein
MNRTVILVYLVVLLIAASLRADVPAAQVAPLRKKVFILINEKAPHLDRTAALRARIERAGGRVHAVIGLTGVVAEIEPGSRASLAAAEGVQEIFDGKMDATGSADAQTRAAVAAWNRIQAGPSTTAKLLAVGPPPGAPPTDVSDPPDLPRNLSQLRMREAAYRRHLQEFRRTLSPQLQRSPSVGCGTNGAGYFDTSLYFAGDIAVGVFYVDGTINGNPAGWTQMGSASTASTSQTFADIVNALDQFLDLQPNARLVFTYENEVDASGNPLPSLSDERTFVNDLRNSRCTDWGYLISVKNGGVWPNAYLLGPSIRLDRTFGWFDYTVLHETGHIFGAGDAYDPNSPAGRFGYLRAAHANACGNGGGFFSGAGECLDDLMAGWGSTLGYNSVIGAYTAGQLGWHASGGDGLLDVMKTKPAIDATSVVHVVNPTTSAATYSGVAFDRPLLDELPFPYGDVSINRITAVQFRIARGTAPLPAAWQDAAPADGVFDSVSEGFQFTTPPLPSGTYRVQIRAANTVAAGAEIQEQLVITGSSIANTRPFASLTVTPERAKFGTMVTASGAGSRDLELGQLAYSFNWDTGWTPFSPSATATHVYTAPGTYTVQIRVRDQGGLIHVVSRSITMEAFDTPPVVSLAAAPENRHFTSNANESVSLSVVGSHDAETPFAQLMVQWDIDCKGSWDAPPTLVKTKAVTLVNAHYPKSDRRCVRVGVTDAAGNTTEARRFVWIVPYNHQPSISGGTFTPTGSDFTLTVNATDADAATTWDGIMEYRFDLDGDGIWDTTFQSTSILALLAAFHDSVVVEVKDRFDGRTRWVPCSPPSPQMPSPC